MKSFCIISNELKDKDLLITKRIVAYLEAHACKFTLLYLKWEKTLDAWSTFPTIPKDAEVILVLGGDGTVMQVARETYGMDIPILGINLGALGYLTEVNCDQVEGALEQLILDDYNIEERMMLKGVVEKKSHKESFIALNDVIVNRSGSLQILYFKVWLNEQLLSHYKADGCIVSTPTGSTGYNLSAGGPIVDPTSKTIVMTTICSHNLFNRGIVLSGDKEVTIEATLDKQGSRQNMQVTFDGNENIHIETGDLVHITQAEHTTKLIRLEMISFIDLLYKKMS
ncbi:MAG: NAD(+)/NADH kinase [Lachnospiraceae bacterium]